MNDSSRPIIVIPADLENDAHASGLLNVLDAYAADPVIGSGRLPQEVKTTLIDSLKSWPGTYNFLACDEDRVVGMINCFSGFSTFRAKPLLNVHDVAVLDEYRGRGIGRMLFDAVFEKAKELGCVKVTLEVYSSNVAAKGLYDSLGFTSDPGGDHFSYFMSRAIT